MEFLPLKINNKNVYAGFRKRSGAYFIDLLILIPVCLIYFKIYAISIPIAIISIFVLNFIFHFYTIFLHYKYGATLGKMFAQIKVTMPDGSPIGFQEAFLRSFIDICYSLIIIFLHIGVLIQFDPELFSSTADIRNEEFQKLSPKLWGSLDTIYYLWFFIELITLLFNERKRALHDFIAGTVVIHKGFAK